MNIRDALKTETATTLQCEAEAQAEIDADDAEWRKANEGKPYTPRGWNGFGLPPGTMGTCDICERPSVMVYGIETTACDECRGN